MLTGIGFFMNIIKDNTLYLILSAEYANGRPVLDIAEQALDAGAGMLQMREKSLSEEALLALGRKLLCLCKKNAVPFIVNDNPYIAKKLNADGVHLGQEDVKKYPLNDTRNMLGRDKIIGISTHSVAEFKNANRQAFDYIAFGPVFPTKTKDYHIGTGDIEEVLKISQKPVFFIGGVNISNINILIEKGAKNIAVIRAITEADDIALVAKTLKKRFSGPCRFASQSEAAGAREAFLIKINGKERSVSKPGNLSELLENAGLSKKAIVIEHNYNIVPKEKWHETTIVEGDNIEIVSFVGGG